MEYDWLSLLPHLILAGGAVLLVAASAVSRRFAGAVAPYFTVAVAAATAVAALVLWREPAVSWFGTLTVDPLFVIFAVIFCAALALVALLSARYAPLAGRDRPEYYALLIMVTCAVSFMASATNLVLIYVAIEFSSILSYVLVGYIRGDRLSGEAGLKYFLYGATASAVMLLGFGLLYAMTGATDLAAIAQNLPRVEWAFGSWGYLTFLAPLTGAAATLPPGTRLRDLVDSDRTYLELRDLGNRVQRVVCQDIRGRLAEVEWHENHALADARRHECLGLYRSAARGNLHGGAAVEMHLRRIVRIDLNVPGRAYLLEPAGLPRHGAGVKMVEHPAG